MNSNQKFVKTVTSTFTTYSPNSYKNNLTNFPTTPTVMDLMLTEIADPAGNGDFVEIYNAGDAAVDFTNIPWYLTAYNGMNYTNVKLAGTLAAGDVFVIAGTGSSFYSSNMIFFQKIFYQAGFHVVCLSSPTVMNFIVTASESGVPGDTVDDARDLYRVMRLIWEQIKTRITVSEFYLTGYSLGATQSAFVAKLDDEKRIFNFKKICMINPAVSLYTSAKILDGMVLKALPGGADTFDVWFKQIFRKFSELYKIMGHQDLTHDFLYEVYRTLYRTDPPKQENMAGMIGTAFRLSASNMLFTSDVMTNFGVIKPKNLVLGRADSLTDYFKVSSRMSFVDYFEELFYPYFQSERPGLTQAALIERSSLRSIDSYLRNNPKIMLMGNADDLILTPEDLAYLKDLFGPRAKIYPSGGHCGNMQYRANALYLIDFFKN